MIPYVLNYCKKCQRKDIFLETLTKNKVELIPRVTGVAKKLMCKHCPYTELCWNQDYEGPEAIRAGQ